MSVTLGGGPLGSSGSGGTTSPGGSTTQVQFNDAGSFGGDAGMTYAKATDTLSIKTVSANNVTATALATPGSITVAPTLSKTCTITTVAGSALVDGDYFTIEYAPGLTVPIEFDLSPGDGTTGGRIPYVFTAGDTADQIRDGLIALLNAAAGTALTASSGGAATVSIVLDTPGAAGGTNSENVGAVGFAVSAWANPTAATTWTYKLVATLSDGTTSAAGAASSTAAGVATLTTANFNRLTWSAVTGAATYKVFRTVAGTSPATTGIIYTGTALTVDDTGLAGGGETAPTANTTGRVLVGDGSAAAPAYSFSNSSGTGFYMATSTKMGVGLSGGANPRWLFQGNSFVSAANFALSWTTTADNAGQTEDLFLSRAAAATLQLGAAGAASPVDQTLRSQNGVGTDKNGAKLTLQGGQSTGTGAGGAIALQTTGSSTTGSTANGYGTRYYIHPQAKTLTIGSATNVFRVDFPASSAVSLSIQYNVTITDAAATPNFKVHGGRYYVSCYRKSTGNAVCSTVVETGETNAASTGTNITDTITATGDANGVIIAQQAAEGTGLTAPTVGKMTWQIEITGTGAATVTAL